MNCREAERLIDTFFDGELDGRSMRDAAMHITRCKRCEAELSDREQVQKLLVRTIDAEVADVDLGRIWAAVEPTLDGARVRRLPGLGWRGLRLAAASSRLSGILVGGTDVRRERADDGEQMVVDWGPEGSRASRAWRWSLAGGTALAASVLLALALVGSGPEEAALRAGPEDAALWAGPAEATLRAGADAGRVASAVDPAPQRVVAAPDVPPAGSGPVVVARESGGAARSAKQVQVESVNFPRSSVAMWSEPATDTTVIWIEDEELVASGRR